MKMGREEQALRWERVCWLTVESRRIKASTS